MDFFAQQTRIRRSSRGLVVLFIVAVLAVVAAVDAVVLVLLGYTGSEQGRAALDPRMLVMVSLGVLVVIGLASTVRSMSLRGGGAAVARSLGATAVSPDTTNPAWRKLRNVIEEIAIASSVPVPDIFVLETEPGINAFAAGYTPSDAAVCVTQGCLDKLTREELQGVIAHEFSHVLNGDMRLNIRLMGLLFGILFIGIVGRLFLYSGGRVRTRKGNTAYVAMIGLGLVVVGYIGYFFGRLIQAAVARSRESLADASAVQFTRQTAGIAGALKKIAALEEGSKLAAANSQEVAHMLFGEAGRFSSLFATHPPLPERIRALGGVWDDKEIRQLAMAWQQPGRARPGQDASASIAGFMPSGAVTAASAEHTTSLPRSDRPLQVDAAKVGASVGKPGVQDMHAAGHMQRQLPDVLAQAVHDAGGALELMLALAVADDASLRDAQLLRVDSDFGSAVAEGVEALLPPISILHPMLRLPLVGLAFPQLKRQPRPRLMQLVQTLDALVHADHRVDLHEYCLVKLLHLQLHDALDPARGFVPGAGRLRQSAAEFGDLCAIVARHGQSDPEKARQAWASAMHEALPSSRASYDPPEEWIPRMDQALDRLDRIRPVDKMLVVRGLTAAVSADGEVTVEEAELLRVICASLHCPLPPLLQHLETLDDEDAHASRD
jgi:Zn-dependent protease with chaperone function